MTALWLNAQSERLVAAFLADARPAWLWAADSERLVWRNRAAIAYEAARKRAPGDVLVPVPRQVPRIIRLGVPLKTSKARLQFTLGRKPVSETCDCTPLLLSGNVSALLAVMNTPVAESELAGIALDPASVAAFTGEASNYVLTGSDGDVLMSGGAGPERLAAGEAPASEMPAGRAESRLIVYPDTATEAPPEAEIPPTEPDIAESEPADTETPDKIEAPVAASENAETPADTPAIDGLVGLFDRLHDSKVLYAPVDDSDDADFTFTAPEAPESFLPPEETRFEDEGATPADLPAAPIEAEAVEDAPVLLEGEEVPSTVDVAVGDEAPEALDEPVAGPDSVDEMEVPEIAPVEADDSAPEPSEEEAAEPDDEAPEPEEPEPEADSTEPVAPAEVPEEGEENETPVKLWRVIGRTILGNLQDRPEDAAQADDGDPDNDTDEALPEDGEEDVAESTEAAEPEHDDEARSEHEEIIEQTSRYNFDELSRILIDRVSAPDGAVQREALADVGAQASTSLVNLGDETLILNRLPIGLLVFRDQQILFSNRALAELLGYVDSSSLRRAGLGGIFPEDGEHNAGPVTRLMGADGRPLTVSARLQTISWQGRQALLLSASQHREPMSAEDLARGFTESLAHALDCGYFETSRAGIVSSLTGRTATLLARSPDHLIGRPIQSILALSQSGKLRSFLEKPARFAGGERPMTRLEGSDPGIEVILFAEGMAGIVTGYFGLVRQVAPVLDAETNEQSINPKFLIRLGRAIRQPITAIIGFADMIRTESFGPVGNDRYIDYAKFIRGAGRDVASVVDELEHYASLSDETFEARTARIDLTEFLETCIARVRGFAGQTRVLVRSGISSRLPSIVADRDTLTQAMLNILASAIAHSQSGGQVVLSAQQRSDGAVEIHVRDSGTDDGTEADERFMVFRDETGVDGEQLTPIQSTIGLALTQSLLAVNSCTLEIEPGPGAGTLASLVIPSELAGGAERAPS